MKRFAGLFLFCVIIVLFSACGTMEKSSAPNDGSVDLAREVDRLEGLYKEAVRVPITPQIVNQVREEKKGYLLGEIRYYTSVNIALIHDSTGASSLDLETQELGRNTETQDIVQNSSGTGPDQRDLSQDNSSILILTFKEGGSSLNQNRISRNDEGQLGSISPKGDIFEISYPNHRITLGFVLNQERNWYDLEFAVEENGQGRVPLALTGARPHLLINYQTVFPNTGETRIQLNNGQNRPAEGSSAVTGQDPAASQLSSLQSLQPDAIDDGSGALDNTAQPVVATEPPDDTAQPIVAVAELPVDTAQPVVIATESPDDTAQPVVATKPPDDTAQPIVAVAELPVDTAQPVAAATPPVDVAQPVVAPAALPNDTAQPVAPATPPVDTAQPVVATEPPDDTAQPIVAVAALPNDTAQPVAPATPPVDTTQPVVVATESPVNTAQPVPDQNLVMVIGQSGKEEPQRSSSLPEVSWVPPVLSPVQELVPNEDNTVKVVLIMSGAGNSSADRTPVVDTSGVNSVAGEEPRASGTYYTIQVGAFREQKNAVAAYVALERDGFNPLYEYHQNLTRVVIPAVDQRELVQTRERIKALGFGDPYVRH
jgi:hypothetical protein